MNAEIISIGDELLIGQVVNTNASWMAAELSAAGIAVIQVTTTSDNGEDISAAIAGAESRADVVLLTGGLGPTRDDITKSVLCNYFHCDLVFSEKVYKHITALFNARGFSLTEVNKQQAFVPERCTVLPNTNGTAPGMWFESGKTIFVSMPGVPFEMKGIMTDHVIPLLTKKNGDIAIIHRTIITHGVGESWLADKIQSWELSLPKDFKLAYLPQPGMVRLRISATGSDRKILEEGVSNEVEKLKLLIPELIVGYGTDTLESVVTTKLIEAGKTVCTAESCTGGTIAQLFTSVPGVSACFTGSVVAYSNNVKQNVLGVNANTLAMYGAVSEAVVIEMAEGARQLMNTDYAIATSGIAGPQGGTEEKPVGTIWIAIATPYKTTATKFLFGDNRERNIKRAAAAALNLLRLSM